MSSTNRGYERHKSDYYVTPIPEIKKFLEEFLKHEPGAFDGHILDPAAGGDEKHPMSYPQAIVDMGISPKGIYTLDIRKDSRAAWKMDYFQSPQEPFDVVITNPPFKLAMEFIKKGMEDTVEGGFTIMLLRLNYFGSKTRKPFWDKYMPKYCFVHHQRMSFTDEGGTDSIEYAHFVWQKDYYPEFTRLKVI